MSHGIGIKRNDYHRRNRKANISMHSHKHGYAVADKDNRTVDTDVTVTIIKQSKLKVLAVEAYGRDRFHRITRQYIKASVAFKCFEYVRHQLSNYDALIRHADTRSYLIILRKTCDKIAKIYPFLASECVRRLKREENKRQHRRIRVIRPSLTQEQVAEYNAKEEEKWKGVLAALEQEERANEDYEVNLTEALSSLASERLLFFPPFLKKDEIERRRFGSGLNNNDRWWEWERELNLKTVEGRPDPSMYRKQKKHSGEEL